MLALGLPGPGTEGFGVELLPFGRRPSSGRRSFSTASYPPAAATIAVKSFCYCSVSATPSNFRGRLEQISNGVKLAVLFSEYGFVLANGPERELPELTDTNRYAWPGSIKSVWQATLSLHRVNKFIE